MGDARVTRGEYLCDCGHEADRHESPAIRHPGLCAYREYEQWCDQCSCARFNPPFGHPEHNPDA